MRVGRMGSQQSGPTTRRTIQNSAKFDTADSGYTGVFFFNLA